MKIICTTTYPEIEVAGIGKFKCGDILTDGKAPVNVLNQLLLNKNQDGGDEWVKAKRDDVAEATVIDGVNVAVAAELKAAELKAVEEPKAPHKKKVGG